MYDCWINCSKPLVMAVNGPCIGEGFTTLMMGDIIYSADSAYFWAPFARFGVVPEITSTITLPQRVGPASDASSAVVVAVRLSFLVARRQDLRPVIGL